LDALREQLLAWYHATRRRLPWREKPSVYGTVVSEMMLQQTQVKTVLPYFDRWLRELPDFQSLAAAPESKVLHLWEGLGYYSRARNLQKLARELLTLPEIPRDQAAWMSLPGIGPYASAAITSIAFGTPVACVDGNVVRILARWTADSTEFRDSASASKHFKALADQVLNPANPGDHNQAMMELGATLCTKHSPQCLLCPVATHCEAQRQGIAGQLPRLAAKIVEKKEVDRVFSLTPAGLLLHRGAGDARRLADLHELPTLEQAGIQAELTRSQPLLLTGKRGITKYQITERIYAAPAEMEAKAPGLVRVPIAQLQSTTLSGPHRRWITELLQIG